MLAPMRQTERVAAVMEALAADGTVDVTALVERLGVSAATVRRDLQLLEEQRMLSRTHGGAVAHDVLYELPCGTRPRATRPRSGGSPRRPRRAWPTAPWSG